MWTTAGETALATSSKVRLTCCELLVLPGQLLVEFASSLRLRRRVRGVPTPGPERPRPASGRAVPVGLGRDERARRDRGPRPGRRRRSRSPAAGAGRRVRDMIDRSPRQDRQEGGARTVVGHISDATSRAGEQVSTLIYPRVRTASQRAARRQDAPRSKSGEARVVPPSRSDAVEPDVVTDPSPDKPGIERPIVTSGRLARKKAAGFAGGLARSEEEFGRTVGGPSAARLAQVHLEIAQIDVGVGVGVVARLVVDLRPAMVVGRRAERLAVPLVLALAVDAAIGVGQGVEPGLGDLAAADTRNGRRRPSTIRFKACSIWPSSRLSISTSCELISSLAVSTAASTLSPTTFRAANSRKPSRSPFRALRRASRRATSRA